MKKTLGIIGGMGPLATCDLMEKIIALTKAGKDQDNIHIVVDCNTNIPDRTAAIVGQGESPVPQLVRSGIKLQGMGADVLVMSCNTAHYFYEELLPYFDVPLLHMVRETGKFLRQQSIKKAGLLATDGTINSGVYEKALAKEGIDIIIPDKEEQKIVMDVIYKGIKGGKAGYHSGEFRRVLENLLDRGAQRLVLGCTELPIAMQKYQFSYPHIDPTEVLAQAAVRFCLEN